MKSRLYAKVSVLVLVSLIAGCATDVANRYYVSEHYDPKDPKEVELLWQRPNRDFVVIADFQSRGESPEAMRKRAAKIGADAVIIAILGGYYAQEEWAGQDSQRNTYTRITGTAIKYK
jgi:adenine/guanine phosphoribosyltransferase-like PRPP-binding protein